jgi:hypothetical protein
LFSEEMYFIVGKTVLLYMKINLDSLSLFSTKALMKLKAKKMKINIRIIERP